MEHNLDPLLEAIIREDIAAGKWTQEGIDLLDMMPMEYQTEHERYVIIAAMQDPKNGRVGVSYAKVLVPIRKIYGNQDM